MDTYIEPPENGLTFGQTTAIAANIFDKIKDNPNVNERFGVLLKQALQGLNEAGEGPMFNGFKIDIDTNPRILSSFFNNAFESMFIDIQALYAQANNTENVINFQERSNESALLKMQDAVKKLQNDVRSYAFLLDNQEFNEVKFNNFSDARNFYTNRDASVVDPTSQSLEIPAIKHNRIHQFVGDRETAISANSQSEGFVISSKNSSPEQAFMAERSKNWSETLLADNPITTTYKGTEYQGAISLVTVTFAQYESINNIKLKPFSEYPIRVVSMEYLSGDEWVDFPSFSDDGAQLGTFEFDSIQVKANAVRFAVLQETYKANVYNIPKSMLITNLLWEQIVEAGTSLDKEDAELFPVDFGRAESEDGFAAYLDALKRYGFKVTDRDTQFNQFNEFEVMSAIVESSVETMGETEPQATDIILSAVTGKHDVPTEEYVQIEKAEYQYGLSYIEINDIQYMSESIYESQKYKTQSTIYEVTLETGESHVDVPDSSGSHRESSIEWELEVAENKKFAILPSGTTLIEGELVNLDRRTGEGNVRFDTSDADPEIRANGELLDSAKYSWIPASGILDIIDFNRNVRYTVDYLPDSGQDTIDLTESNSIEIEFPEIFQGTDERGSIQLNYYPFIVYDIINDKDRWVQHDPTVASWTYRNSQGLVTIDGTEYGDGSASFYEPIQLFVDGVKAFNITDYRSGETPAFSSTINAAHQFEYVQIGNSIYLNQVIPGNKQIQVVYSYLAKYLKMNAKLRCNTVIEYPYTPRVGEYQLNLKTANI